MCEQQPAPAVNDSLKDVAAKSVSLTNVWRRLPFPTTGGSFRNVSENAPALLGQDGLHIAQAQSHQPWSAPAFTCVGEPPLEENGGEKKRQFPQSISALFHQVSSMPTRLRRWPRPLARQEAKKQQIDGCSCPSTRRTQPEAVRRRAEAATPPTLVHRPPPRRRRLPNRHLGGVEGRIRVTSSARLGCNCQQNGLKWLRDCHTQGVPRHTAPRR